MMISKTIIIELFATVAMFANIANAAKGKSASCSCGEITNLLICEDLDDKQICFCNMDGNVYCKWKSNRHMEIEHDTVIRVGDSVRVCLLPQDTTGGDLTSIKEIIDVTCSNGMDQAFSIIPISVQDELDHVTFEFSNGAGRGFQTIIKREYTPFSKGNGGVSFACSGSVSLSTTISRRRHRHLVQTTSAVKEAFSLSVNIGNINDDNETVTSGYTNIAKDIGTNLASITIIATGLLFL